MIRLPWGIERKRSPGRSCCSHARARLLQIRAGDRAAAYARSSGLGSSRRPRRSSPGDHAGVRRRPRRNFAGDRAAFSFPFTPAHISSGLGSSRRRRRSSPRDHAGVRPGTTPEFRRPPRRISPATALPLHRGSSRLPNFQAGDPCSPARPPPAAHLLSSRVPSSLLPRRRAKFWMLANQGHRPMLQ